MIYNTDGGEKWEAQNSDVTSVINNIQMLDGLNGFASTRSNVEIFSNE